MASVLMVIVVLFFLCHSSRIIVNFYEALQVTTMNMFWLFHFPRISYTVFNSHGFSNDVILFLKRLYNLLSLVFSKILLAKCYISVLP